MQLLAFSTTFTLLCSFVAVQAVVEMFDRHFVCDCLPPNAAPPALIPSPMSLLPPELTVPLEELLPPKPVVPPGLDIPPLPVGPSLPKLPPSCDPSVPPAPVCSTNRRHSQS